MDFKPMYLEAMREQAPKMFNEMRKTGALEAHAQRKSEEAHAMYAMLTKGQPTLPNGLVADLQARRTAESEVRSALIQFQSEGRLSSPSGEPIPQPETPS